MKLESYLADLAHVSDVRPCRVTIGRRTYESAFYRQTCRDGAGTFKREGLYMLGDLPSCYERSTRVAFTLPEEFNDSRLWYVATYGTSALMLNPEFARYHPCGAFVVLMPWDSAHGEIDSAGPPYDPATGRATPYARVAIGIELPEPPDLGEDSGNA